MRGYNRWTWVDTVCWIYDEQLKQSFLMASLTVAPRSPRVVSAWSGAVSKCRGERRAGVPNEPKTDSIHWSQPIPGPSMRSHHLVQVGILVGLVGIPRGQVLQQVLLNKADSFSGYGPWRRWSALEVWGTKFTKIVVFRSDSWLLGQSWGVWFLNVQVSCRQLWRCFSSQTVTYYSNALVQALFYAKMGLRRPWLWTFKCLTAICENAIRMSEGPWMLDINSEINEAMVCPRLIQNDGRNIAEVARAWLVRRLGRWPQLADWKSTAGASVF